MESKIKHLYLAKWQSQDDAFNSILTVTNLIYENVLKLRKIKLHVLLPPLTSLSIINPSHSKPRLYIKVAYSLCAPMYGNQSNAMDS